MARTTDDALRWTLEGTELFLEAVERLEVADFEAASRLPSWTRRHVVAHVAANADALRNLVRWAATGEPTPMYASPEERAAGIQRGARMPVEALTTWLRMSSENLRRDMDDLTAARWATKVTTAQGRAVLAAEVPWLRAREVNVHAIDLDRNVEFVRLPIDFLEALHADVLAKRGKVPSVDAPLDQRVAWLTGRPHHIAGAPTLGPWL